MANREQKEKCTLWFKTLKIGKTISDVKYKRDNLITNLTKTSVELFHLKVTNKGIDCKQWYDIDRLSDLTLDYENR